MTMEGDIHLPLIVCRPRKHLARPIHNTPFRSNTRSNYSYLVKERILRNSKRKSKTEETCLEVIEEASIEKLGRIAKFFVKIDNSLNHFHYYM